MNGKLRPLFLTMLLGLLVAAIYAQTRPDQQQNPPAAAGGAQSQPQQAPGMGGMDPKMREQFMARHKQMLEMMQKMQQMNEDLEKKVGAMNAATGEAKVNAMADVINLLVQQRQAIMKMGGCPICGGSMPGMGGMGGMGMGGGMGHGMPQGGGMGGGATHP